MTPEKKIQILGQLGEKIYKQAEEPADAPDGSIWIDLDENKIPSDLDEETIIQNFINSEILGGAW